MWKTTYFSSVFSSRVFSSLSSQRNWVECVPAWHWLLVQTEEGGDKNSIPPKNTVFPLYFWKCVLGNRWLFLFNNLKRRGLGLNCLLFLTDIRIGVGPSSSSELDSAAQCLDCLMRSVSWSPVGEVNQASFTRVLSPLHYRSICQRTIQARAPREEAESLNSTLSDLEVIRVHYCFSSWKTSSWWCYQRAWTQVAGGTSHRNSMAGVWPFSQTHRAS